MQARCMKSQVFLDMHQVYELAAMLSCRCCCCCTVLQLFLLLHCCLAHLVCFLKYSFMHMACQGILRISLCHVTGLFFLEAVVTV